MNRGLQLKKTVKTVSFMMIATLLSKVAGLLRDVVIAAKYGTESMQATAYSYASSLPVQLFDFTLGAAVLATFIPIFNGYLEKGDRKRSRGTQYRNDGHHPCLTHHRTEYTPQIDLYFFVFLQFFFVHIWLLHALNFKQFQL